MTMTDQPTTVRRGAILAVLHTAPMWHRGTRKSDGAPMASIPGSNGHVYQVTMDSCDCRDSLARHRSCKHQYALTEKINEETMAAWLKEIEGPRCPDGPAVGPDSEHLNNQEMYADLAAQEARRERAATFERLYPADEFDRATGRG